jgi:hypothetical protein
VIGDEQGDPVIDEPADLVLELFDAVGIDAREGLVQQQQLGPDDQGPGDLEPPAFSARARPGLVARLVLEAELREQLFGARLAVVFGELLRLQDGQEAPRA